MTVFISGGAKCGKSGLAQELVLKLANGGIHYYLATMIPSGAEDYERIRRHLLDRAGMGFETVECAKNVMETLITADKNGAFLVDSVTSLMQNALFPAENNYEPDPPGAKRCTDDLVEFARTVRHAVFVSDDIFRDAGRYDPATEQYRRCLAEADRSLARVCDTVLEVTAGQVIVHKGELPK